MKRLALAGIALLGILGIVAPRPVLADTGDDPVTSIVKSLETTLRAPSSWHERSICVGNQDIGKAWCIYFAWPY